MNLDDFIKSPFIQNAIKKAKIYLDLSRERDRHQWVQQIKANYRKNKRKRRRCKRKLK